MIRKVYYEGRLIEYELTVKQVKNMNLRIKSDGSVHVSVNRYITRAQADDFVLRNGEYIMNALERFEKRRQENKPAEHHFTDGETVKVLGQELVIRLVCGKKDTAEQRGDLLVLMLKEPDDEEARRRLVKKYLDALCRQVFPIAVDRMLPLLMQYGVELPELKYRSMKSRWGTCAVQKRIVTLNTQLIYLPMACIEYVVLHELCHFVHADHSKNFHDLMTKLMPDWKVRKSILNTCNLRQSVL